MTDALELEYGIVWDVTEEPAGDELAVAAAVGDLTLTLGDAVDFDEDGGWLLLDEVEELSYTAADLDTDTVTLTAPLGTAYPEETPVQVAPPVVERRTLVQLDLDGEAVDARVPHALFDRLPLGTREAGGERVSLSLEGGEWVVSDVLGKVPSVDGSFIDPTTLPPPALSDGLPPDSSPTPAVIGGVGVLHVRWGGVTNADAVTYDVHLSTVDGFTPDASTLAAQTPGTAITLRAMPDGTPLAYGVTYFVRLVAQDPDPGEAPPSPQASGVLHEVANEEISAGYAYLGEVSADQIITGTMSAEVTVSGMFQTSTTGRRVVMDAEGVRLHDSAGNSLVDLPTDATKAAQFKGTAELETATVKSGLSLQKPSEAGKSAATVLPGGTLELANGVKPPGSAPAVSVHLNIGNLSGLGTAGAGASWHYNDVHADAANLWVATADPENTLRVHRFDRTTGAVTRAANPSFTSTQLPSSANQTSLVGLTRLGATFYLCLLTSAAPESGTYRVIGFTDDTFTTQTGPEWTVSASNEQVIGLHADGTSVWVASLVCNRDATFGELRARQLTASTMTVAGGPWDSGFSIRNNAKGDTGAIRGGLYYGTAGGQWSTPRVVAHGYDESETRVFTIGATALERQTADEWPLDRLGPHTWDGSRFLQMAGSSTKSIGTSAFSIYSNLRWTTESPVWWASYAWLHSAQGKRTPQSPRTSFTMTKRRFLTITGEEVPLTGAVDDPDSARHYLGRGAADPGVAGMFKAGDGESVAVPDTFTFTGENPVTTTGFASSAASDLRSGALRRDGAPLSKVASDGSANVDGLIPPGTITMYAGTTAPTGWRLCNGDGLSAALNPDLFNAIGYAFGGSGDTFYVPDLRGRFPLGASPAALKGTPGDSEAASSGSAPGVGDPGRLTHRHTHTISGQPSAVAWSVANGSLGEAPRRTAFEGHNHGGATGQAGVGPSLTSNLEYHGMLTLNFIVKL